MYKRVICFVMVVLMIFSLASCKTEDNKIQYGLVSLVSENDDGLYWVSQGDKKLAIELVDIVPSEDGKTEKTVFKLSPTDPNGTHWVRFKLENRKNELIEELYIDFDVKNGIIFPNKSLDTEIISPLIIKSK